MVTNLNPNLIMFIVAILFLLVGVLGGAAVAFLSAKGKNPQAVLATADKAIDGAVTANSVVGNLIPAPVESIIDKVLKTAQAGVHAAQQLCNSNQLTEDERKQKAFDAAMNLLKLEGYDPTPELETAVKDAIEAGVFVVKNIPKPAITTITQPVAATADPPPVQDAAPTPTESEPTPSTPDAPVTDAAAQTETAAPDQSAAIPAHQTVLQAVQAEAQKAADQARQQVLNQFTSIVQQAVATPDQTTPAA